MNYTYMRIVERGLNKIYLGCGEPLIGFCPYFLHEYSSGGISATLLLIAGTLIDLFTLNFLKTKTKVITNKINKKDRYRI